MTDQSGGTPAAPSEAPLRRPRGRERYPADVVVDAPPSSARVADDETAEGLVTQGRLVLALDELEATRGGG